VQVVRQNKFLTFLMKTNERFTWATTILNPEPQDHILEIGCGAGLFAEQITRKLHSGTLTALDRSASMIKLSSKRNASAVLASRVKFLQVGFLDAKFKKNEFDKVIAFNVNFFWKESKRELDVVQRILKPTGQLYVFYQAPTWLRIEAADPIKKNLEENSFEVTDIIFEKMAPTPVFCVKAKPRM
jgi:ubiquinone/menaquinone biosynthesis C-methylase UbiE